MTYAILIAVMSCISIAWEIYSAKANEVEMRKLTRVEAMYPVLRDGRLVHLDTAELVVGDAILLSASNIPLEDRDVVCDMALVQGECVMDESSLTGESVPIVKVPLPLVTSEGHPEGVHPERNKGNMLFAGSKFIQLKSKKNWLAEQTNKSPGYNPVATTDEQQENNKEMVIAIVTASGFASTKGELFRSILFPNRIDFKFNRDAYKFLFGLSIIAIIACINRVVNSLNSGQTLSDSILLSFDLITVAVPPALPLILSAGIGFSMSRLKKSRIFCINPQRINFAGRIDVMCWDKTGTLTESELRFSSVDRVTKAVFDGPTSQLVDISALEKPSLEHCMVLCHSVNVQDDGKLLGHSLDIEMVRSTGWSLFLPTELEALSKTHSRPFVCAMKPTTNSDKTFVVHKRFDFDAHLQRSSVIASLDSSEDSEWLVIAKGSPEAIRLVCKPETLPSNYYALCQTYALRGLYVIACAYRNIDPAEFPNKSASQLSMARRERMDKNLSFLGFMLFENRLKPETLSTIHELKDAQIRSVIITGDNALTAVHVARQVGLCRHVLLVDLHESQVMFSEVPSQDDEPEDVAKKGYSPTSKPGTTLTSKSSISPATKAFDVPLAVMTTVQQSTDSMTQIDLDSLCPIDEIINRMSVMPAQTEIAVTGQALAKMLDGTDVNFVDWLVGRTRIFSRVKPSQKTWLIERLIKQGKYVGMCGDGTNDCGALKAAHAGLALSDAEASIVAPFTSASKSVADVTSLFREGRCALETSFVAFKYMTLYPMIQLMMSAYANQVGTALSNNQFLFDDMGIVTLLALFMLYTRPASRLSPDRPTDDLFSPLILSSIFGQVAICIIVFAINMALTWNQPWFCSITDATVNLDGQFNPLNASSPDTYPCYPISSTLDVNIGALIKSFENTSDWLFGHILFSMVAFSFCVKSRYRQPFWTNYLFTGYFVFIFIVTCCMLLFLVNTSAATEPGPAEYSNGLALAFNIQTNIPFSFRATQFAIICAACIASVCWEIFVVDVAVRRYTKIRERKHQQSLDYQRDRAVGIHNMQEMSAIVSSPLYGAASRPLLQTSDGSLPNSVDSNGSINVVVQQI